MNIGAYGSIGRRAVNTKPMRIGGVSMPDFNSISHYTKSPRKMSEEKFREAIAAQAKKDHAAGKFQNDSDGFNKLIKSYVTVASPDRKGILEDGIKAIFKNTSSIPKPMSLLDVFLKNGSAKYQKEDNELTFAEFYDSEGNMIASYDRGKWTELRTPDETARQIEFCSIYNQAWGDAKRAAANPPPDDGGVAAFDQLA